MQATLPFKVNQYEPQEGSAVGALDNLLGQRFTTDLRDGYGDREFMLVELVGALDVRGKALKWSDRATFKVAAVSAVTDRVVGVGYYGLKATSVPTLAYFLLQTRGRAQVIHGDDGVNLLSTSLLPYVLPDDDADTGKVRGVLVPSGDQCPFGRYVSGTAADNAVMVIDLQIQDMADVTGAGSVATADLADDAVTAAKLADDASVDANRAVTTNHIRDDAVTAAKVADGAIDDAAKLASGVVTTAKILAANVTPTKMAFTGMKIGAFVGAAAAGACTLTGAAVGDRVVCAWIFGDVSDNLTKGTGSVITSGTTGFENAITVANQIQQTSASDLSDNKYMVILAPASA